MTVTPCERFSCHAAMEVLAGFRRIAESEGRQFPSVLDDAPRDDLDRSRTRWPRLRAMAAFAASLGEFDELYRKFAK